MIATSNNEYPRSVHDHDLPGADSIPCCSADAFGADMSIIRTMTNWYLLLLLPLTSIANAISTPSYHQCTSSPQCKLHPAVVHFRTLKTHSKPTRGLNGPYLSSPNGTIGLKDIIVNTRQYHHMLLGSFVTTLQRIKQRARWDSEVARQKHICYVQNSSITLSSLRPAGGS
jgi:hypothetical protein